MLDINILLNLNEAILKKFAARGIDPEKVHALAVDYNEIRKLKKSIEEQQTKKNILVEQFAYLKKEKKSEEENSLKTKLVELKSNIQNDQLRLGQLQTRFDEQWSLLPNLPLDDEIPIGDESKNKVVRSWGDRRSFSFQPSSHEVILENQGLIDSKRAVKLAGTRFITYRGKGAKLIRALQQFTLDINTKNGYEELLPPVLVNWKSFYSSGQFPKFQEDVFGISGRDLYLSSTGEVQLVNFFRNEILAEKDLPILLTTSTINFRSEAGSAGKDLKGIIRLHQFYKTELVKICKVENGIKEHESMVLNACEILEKLNLPYRQVLLASQDMSASAQKTYDLEVWMPGSNKYREISSISYCGTYQARRAMIRYNSGKVGDNKYVATLNGSGLALDRLLAAIVENYQTIDGNFELPPALNKYI